MIMYQNAGQLPDRVSVYTRTETSDGHDGVTEAWAVTRRRLAASVMPLQGKDLERARQVDPRVSHEVKLRFWQDYRTDLKGGRARLIYHDVGSDVTFEIVRPPVDVESAHVTLMMHCSEVV